jgi:hypothetical protein
LEGYYEKESLITWTERYDIALQLAKGENMCTVCPVECGIFHMMRTTASCFFGRSSVSSPGRCSARRFQGREHSASEGWQLNHREN